MDQLGAAIGVARGQISNWESGKRVPGPKSLFQLSKVLEFGLNTIANIGEHRQEAVQLIDPPVMQIPLVSQYAYAGYLEGYQNTTYMTDLPKVPFNVDHYGKGKYLAFEVRGDSCHRHDRWQL